jgi:hypothetical protein
LGRKQKSAVNNPRPYAGGNRGAGCMMHPDRAIAAQARRSSSS